MENNSEILLAFRGIFNTIGIAVFIIFAITILLITIRNYVRTSKDFTEKQINTILTKSLDIKFNMKANNEKIQNQGKPKLNENLHSDILLNDSIKEDIKSNNNEEGDILNLLNNRETF